MQDEYTSSDYPVNDYPSTDSTGTDYSSDYSDTYTTMPYDPQPSAADSAAGLAIAGGIMLFVFILCIALYIYFSLALMKIAQKSNTENAWFAWVPILSTILIVQIAKKPLWWILLMFIPFVNIVITILVWMEVAKAVGKPDWLGILMLVPIANIIVPGYLAWSQTDTPVFTQPQGPQTPISPQAPAMPQ